jgi:hypothetical protein
LNFYSPGKPDHLAAILPTLTPPTDSILLGDLNAHHTWWQGPLPPTIRTSRASQAIADWLETHDFRLHNKIALPTHHPRNGTNPSTIDLCLSKGNIGNDILALAINHDTTSDHSSATITLTFPGETLKHQEKPRRNWNRADWPAFKTLITNARMDLSNLQGKDDTLRAVTNITNLIHHATNKTIPLGGQRKHIAPWWTHHLTLAKLSVQKADRKARAAPDDLSLRHDSMQKRHKWTSLVRTAKTSYRTKQLQSATTGSIWKTLKNHNTHHQPIPPLNGHTDFEGKCNRLREALFPAKNDEPRPHLPPNLLPSKHDLAGHYRQVTQHEVSTALTHLRLHSAAGADGINYTTTQHFHEAAPHL